MRGKFNIYFRSVFWGAKNRRKNNSTIGSIESVEKKLQEQQEREDHSKTWPSNRCDLSKGRPSVASRRGSVEKTQGEREKTGGEKTITISSSSSSSSFNENRMKSHPRSSISHICRFCSSLRIPAGTQMVRACVKASFSLFLSEEIEGEVSLNATSTKIIFKWKVRGQCLYRLCYTKNISKNIHMHDIYKFALCCSKFALLPLSCTATGFKKKTVKKFLLTKLLPWVEKEESVHLLSPPVGFGISCNRFANFSFEPTKWAKKLQFAQNGIDYSPTVNAGILL